MKSVEMVIAQAMEEALKGPNRYVAVIFPNRQITSRWFEFCKTSYKGHIELARVSATTFEVSLAGDSSVRFISAEWLWDSTRGLGLAKVFLGFPVDRELLAICNDIEVFGV